MNTGARVGPPACAFDPDKLTVALDLLIASRIEAISPAVSKIMTLIRKTSCAPEHDFAVETALQEALANAVVHDNHLDPGKMVRTCCACQEDRRVMIIVKDEGEGFDATKVPSPLVGERIHSEHGRGIYLVNMLMDEVRFERVVGRSTCVRIRKDRRRVSERAGKQRVENNSIGTTSIFSCGQGRS